MPLEKYFNRTFEGTTAVVGIVFEKSDIPFLEHLLNENSIPSKFSNFEYARSFLPDVDNVYCCLVHNSPSSLHYSISVIPLSKYARWVAQYEGLFIETFDLL